MVSHSQHQPQPQANPSRDAVRSRAWRQRHGRHLHDLLEAAGVQPTGQGRQSHMAQLKKVFAAAWTKALTAAPASMIRHDPSLSRAERRRISSVKNNRLCRHRHHVFLDGVENELVARGKLSADQLRPRVTPSRDGDSTPSAPASPSAASVLPSEPRPGSQGAPAAQRPAAPAWSSSQRPAMPREEAASGAARSGEPPAARRDHDPFRRSY